MTVTTTSLTRAAGISAAVAGLLFIDQRKTAASTAGDLATAPVEPAAVR